MSTQWIHLWHRLNAAGPESPRPKRSIGLFLPPPMVVGGTLVCRWFCEIVPLRADLPSRHSVYCSFLMFFLHLPTCHGVFLNS